MQPTLGLLLPVGNEDQAVGPTSNLLKGIINTIGVKHTIPLGEKKALSEGSKVLKTPQKRDLKQQQLDYAMDTGTLPKAITV